MSMVQLLSRANKKTNAATRLTHMPGLSRSQSSGTSDNFTKTARSSVPVV
jgi:hypothetical protein